jgi:hypothetical protein
VQATKAAICAYNHCIVFLPLKNFCIGFFNGRIVVDFYQFLHLNLKHKNMNATRLQGLTPAQHASFFGSKDLL